MPESLKFSARKPSLNSLTQKSLHRFYQCLSCGDAGSSSGQVIAVEKGSDRVWEFLLVKKASANNRQSVEGGCGSVGGRTVVLPPPFNGVPEEM